jgi:hypothetical protein
VRLYARRVWARVHAFNLLAFTSAYVFESGLFSGLQTIEIKNRPRFSGLIGNAFNACLGFSLQPQIPGQEKI